MDECCKGKDMEGMDEKMKEFHKKHMGKMPEMMKAKMQHMAHFHKELMERIKSIDERLARIEEKLGKE